MLDIKFGVDRSKTVYFYSDHTHRHTDRQTDIKQDIRYKTDKIR